MVAVYLPSLAVSLQATTLNMELLESTGVSYSPSSTEVSSPSGVSGSAGISGSVGAWDSVRVTQIAYSISFWVDMAVVMPMMVLFRLRATGISKVDLPSTMLARYLPPLAFT